MCVMCSTSVPTLFQYFFYDHIPTCLYIFHEMFFITCIIIVELHLAGLYWMQSGKKGSQLAMWPLPTRLP